MDWFVDRWMGDKWITRLINAYIDTHELLDEYKDRFIYICIDA